MYLSDSETATLQALLHGPGLVGDHVPIETLERRLPCMDRRAIGDTLKCLERKKLLRHDGSHWAEITEDGVLALSSM